MSQTPTPEEEVNVVYTMPRHDGEEIHFTLRKYKGRSYVDLRLWYQENPKEDFRPTKRGISVGAELLPKLQEGLNEIFWALTKQKKAPHSVFARALRKALCAESLRDMVMIVRQGAIDAEVKL